MPSLLRLMSTRVKTSDGEWHLIAKDAPVAVDIQGHFIDIGPSLLESFGGGGVQAWDNAELEVCVRWVAPPPDDEGSTDAG